MSKKVHMPVLLILAIIQLAVMGIAGVAGSQEDEVIATLNGEAITLEEAQERVAFQIYRLRGNIYFLLKREIENIVDQKLLAEEAARRGMMSFCARRWTIKYRP